MIFTSLNKRILTVINDKDRFLKTVAIAFTPINSIINSPYTQAITTVAEIDGSDNLSLILFLRMAEELIK